MRSSQLLSATPRMIVAAALGLAVLWLVDGPALAQPLRVGVAQVRITPPVGVPMAGYYHERHATGVHDELYAKAIVLDQDGTRAALVALDLISTTPQIVAAARKAIEETTGVPGTQTMISATHVHTGPVLKEVYRSLYPTDSGRPRIAWYGTVWFQSVRTRPDG